MTTPLTLLACTPFETIEFNNRIKKDGKTPVMFNGRPYVLHKVGKGLVVEASRDDNLPVFVELLRAKIGDGKGNYEQMLPGSGPDGWSSGIPRSLIPSGGLARMEQQAKALELDLSTKVQQVSKPVADEYVLKMGNIDPRTPLDTKHLVSLIESKSTELRLSDDWRTNRLTDQVFVKALKWIPVIRQVSASNEEAQKTLTQATTLHEDAHALMLHARTKRNEAKDAKDQADHALSEAEKALADAREGLPKPKDDATANVQKQDIDDFKKKIHECAEAGKKRTKCKEKVETCNREFQKLEQEYKATRTNYSTTNEAVKQAEKGVKETSEMGNNKLAVVGYPAG